MRRFEIHDLWTTSITEAEIMVGIALMPAGRRRQGLDDAARHYAEIIGLRTRRGAGVPTLDVMIAAIARASSAAVATRNVSHFEDCGVVIHDPWSDG